ncbi:SDR family oxidoreductase [Burkholderia sp. SCN-KJ]|nr:SDR family oxidoreductase [Burkholderia sp. SCN-KJ]MCR4470439.1 SDR family oxidoreductase [Burkholderia sp. SCN-KJ]
MPPYGTTKASVQEFTRHTDVEWRFTWNPGKCSVPGFIMTDLSKGSYGSLEIIARRFRSVASRKLGSPEDIAKAVTFLAGDDEAIHQWP